MMIVAILIPLFVQVALTFALLFWAAARRTRDIRTGAVDPNRIALREPLWPGPTAQVAYAFGNQLELPVLFYVLVGLLIELHHADLLFVVLAWLFVIARLAHAGIHVTRNVIAWRGPVFGIGAVILLIMWVIFAVEILTRT
jgi:hypothetical protein